jgi:hypothetical protein
MIQFLAINLILDLKKKDTVKQTGLKRKTQQSVVYKRSTLLTEPNTGIG